MPKTLRTKHATLVWRPERVVDNLTLAMREGAQQAALYYLGELKSAISLPGPKTKKQKKKLTKGQLKRIQAADVELRASRPGEPPRRRTGVLRNSTIAIPRAGGRVWQVGYATTAPYGPALEFGNPKRGLEARPAQRLTLAKTERALLQIMINRLKGALHGGK